MTKSPYLTGLELVKQNSGTSGQAALAKCILSLYNPHNSFSIGEVLAPLDDHYTAVVLAMVAEYAARGETEELRIAGRWVCNAFPGLLETVQVMQTARSELRAKWDREREEEAARLYPNG